MIKYLVIILVSSNAIIAQNFAIKIAHYDPSGSNEDLKDLDQYFENRRLIGLGESTHGTHEFFVMRHRLIRYLVENHGYKTVFMEADYANSLAIDDYIKGKGEATADDAVKSLGLWPWITEELVELVEWLRLYNQSNPSDQVEFVGVDVQKFDETVERLERLLQKYELPTRQDEVIDASTFFKLSDKKILELRSIEVPRYEGADISGFSDEDRYEYKWLSRHLNQILSEKLEKKSMQSAYRDRMMAENILEHLKEDEFKRGVFWAHNGHIANLFNEKQNKGVAGGYLKKQLGDKYFILGHEFDYGSFNALVKPEDYSKDYSDWKMSEVQVEKSPQGSMAANFRSIEHASMFIPFDMLPADAKVYMNYIGAVYWTNKKGEASDYLRRNNHGRKSFDAIILIKKSTPTRLLD